MSIGYIDTIYQQSKIDNASWLVRNIQKKKLDLLEIQSSDVQELIKLNLQISRKKITAEVDEIIKSDYPGRSKYKKIRKKITTALDKSLVRPSYDKLENLMKDNYDALYKQLYRLNSHFFDYKEKKLEEFIKSLNSLDLNRKLEVLSDNMPRISLMVPLEPLLENRIKELAKFVRYPWNRKMDKLELVMEKRRIRDDFLKNLKYLYLDDLKSNPEDTFGNFVRYIISQEELSVYGSQSSSHNSLYFEPTILVDFDLKEQLYNLLIDKKNVALNGDKVKSETERRLLNHLLTIKLNGIGNTIKTKYEYLSHELSYNEGRGIIKPDLLLPDFKIIIEHFAIKSGRSGHDSNNYEIKGFIEIKETIRPTEYAIEKYEKRRNQKITPDRNR